MDIGSISSMYLNNVKDSASRSTDLADKLKNGMEGKSDEELMEACKEFEAYFTEQIFKNMRKSMVPASEEDSGSMSTLKNYFEDELWKNYSSAAADQSNNGLAQMLYEQMKRNLGTELPKEPDESAVAAVSSEVVSEEE
ncbi:MAG: rod-binding protein [Lachnospiraceae bacterium]|nr:rod-binding protein [Lachnospiraceae bacterium]